jgi:hypothetical protein
MRILSKDFIETLLGRGIKMKPWDKIVCKGCNLSVETLGAETEAELGIGIGSFVREEIYDLGMEIEDSPDNKDGIDWFCNEQCLQDYCDAHKDYMEGF